ncbi:calcium-binding protein [Microvirga sp. CF3062]|uniref:calcium-binding protein n=1 Tax=Microvirga sp. CF3062 TaxID=3110182 RepID=UPI002E79F668|nr:calcium-binding protein [Microvirga sp. CF3062]MEE1655671.1 calcium-binding protein [Microvirga sp. CF3062]
MFFLRQFYNMTSTEVKYIVQEYNNVKYFSTLEDILFASRDSEALFYEVDVTGNELANHITGSSMSNVLDGGAGQDTLDGGAGDDVLYGGLGADLLTGGNGNDSYNVDNAGDVVSEANTSGTDFVYSKVSYVLSDNVENLSLGGSGQTSFESYENINGTGNALDNWLTGNAGNNHLRGLEGDDRLSDGGAGQDTLEGGSGDDMYYIESTSSTVIEAANGGVDTAFLMFQVSDLGAVDFSKLKNVERIHFSNFASGKYAILEDGEFFVLDDKVNAKKPTDLDDFQVKEDTIGLSKSIFSKIAKKGDLKKGAFWTGSKAHDKDDRIVYDKKAGDLYYDADGSGARKAVKFADVDKNLKMAANDFLVF